jgi:hypothetical protein
MMYLSLMWWIVVDDWTKVYDTKLMITGGALCEIGGVWILTTPDLKIRFPEIHHDPKCSMIWWTPPTRS